MFAKFLPNQIASVISPASSPFPPPTMTNPAIVLQNHNLIARVKVVFRTQTVVASKPVDVAGEGGKVSAGELLCPRASDDFYHPEHVRVDIFQVTHLFKVTEKP